MGIAQEPGKLQLAAQAEVDDEDLSYYERFGGDRKMAIFVEDFMEGIMADPELACHHAQFQDPEKMEMLKEKLCAYFKYKLDGTRFYIGKSMPDVHRNLGITHEVFDMAGEVLKTSLRKMNVSPAIFEVFFSRIVGIRHEICFPPAK